MRYLSVFVPLALLVASCATAHTTLADAHNALDAADKGLSSVVPAIAVACREVPDACPKLTADLKVAQDAANALRGVTEVGDVLDSAVNDLGVSIRTLLIDLQAAKAKE